MCYIQRFSRVVFVLVQLLPAQTWAVFSSIFYEYVTSQKILKILYRFVPWIDTTVRCTITMLIHSSCYVPRAVCSPIRLGQADFETVITSFSGQEIAKFWCCSNLRIHKAAASPRNSHTHIGCRVLFFPFPFSFLSFWEVWILETMASRVRVNITSFANKFSPASVPDNNIPELWHWDDEIFSWNDIISVYLHVFALLEVKYGQETSPRIK